MRRLSVVALVVALVASMSAVALAQEGPKVSGAFLLDYEYPLSGSAAVDQSYMRFRLGVSGKTTPNVGYQLQLQYLNEGFRGSRTNTISLRLANATFQSSAVPGLGVAVGRQYLAWSNLNWFGGLFAGIADGVAVSVPVNPLKLDLFYGQKDAGKFVSVARAAYTSQVAGANVDIIGQLRGQSDGSQVGYGVGAKGSLGTLGSLYAEVGQDNASNSDYQVVGVNVDVLKPATGVTAWVEYNLKASELAWWVGREMLPGLKLYVTNAPPSRYTPGGLASSAALVAETSLSF